MSRLLDREYERTRRDGDEILLFKDYYDSELQEVRAVPDTGRPDYDAVLDSKDVRVLTDSELQAVARVQIGWTKKGGEDLVCNAVVSC